MVLEFLGDERSLDFLKDLLEHSEGESVYTIQLATAASQLGFNVRFFTAEPWREHDDEYYREHSPGIGNEELYSQAEEAGVELNFEELELDEVLRFLSEHSIPIVLLDWNMIEGEEGYQGHFVPVVGYTDSKVIFHEPSSKEGAFTRVARETFDKARKAEGTDQDIAVIRRK